MRKKLLFVLLSAAAGLAAGIFFRASQVKACSPEGGCPVKTEATASVAYDEVWQPVEAAVVLRRSSGKYAVGTYNFASGTVSFPDGTSQSLSGSAAGEISSDGRIKHMPKFKVTVWHVEGHAHFIR